MARLYRSLRAEAPDAEAYTRFVMSSGQPALELGCGTGDPLLELRSRGLDVEGVDSSADMLERCRIAAAERGLKVVLHHQAMQDLDLGRRFRSIYLAGPTFNLLPDDDVALTTLAAISRHLHPEGSALIPLFIPAAVSPGDLNRAREHVSPEGLMRFMAIASERDEEKRLQTTVLRYEFVTDASTEVVERPWCLHWHTQHGFRRLADQVGLATRGVFRPDGTTANETDSGFTFQLSAARA